MVINDEHAKNTSNGDCQSNNTKSTDVIIVGAGVAGSALAYTLAKVVYRDLSVYVNENGEIYLQFSAEEMIRILFVYGIFTEILLKMMFSPIKRA